MRLGELEGTKCTLVKVHFGDGKVTLEEIQTIMRQ
jgi:hypothetical protein